MKLNKIIKSTPRELFSTFKEKEVSFKTMLELSLIKDKEHFESAVEMITEGHIDNSSDIKNFNQIITSDNESYNEDDFDEQENKSSVKEKVEDFKKMRDMSEEEKQVKNVTFSVNKIHRELMNINVDKLSKDQLNKLKNALEELSDVIKKKRL